MGLYNRLILDFTVEDVEGVEETVFGVYPKYQKDDHNLCSFCPCSTRCLSQKPKKHILNIFNTSLTDPVHSLKADSGWFAQVAWVKNFTTWVTFGTSSVRAP